jgi:hypothetical protein
MEKIIQWSYELPPIDYSNIKGKFGFDSIRCDEGFDEVMAIAGYLSFRKWLRIYNRIKGIEISGGNVRKGDIAFSIIAECFPDIERFLRQRPDMVNLLRSSGLSTEKFGELISRIEDIETGRDKTVAKEIMESTLQVEE